MEFTKLKQALAAEAKAAGICEQWYYYILRATNKESLIALFNKGLDFCINKRFPSAELRAEFDGVRQHFGVYDSEEFTKSCSLRDSCGTHKNSELWRVVDLGER